MERGEARCVPAASRSCNGAEPVQPEDSHAFDGKRGWMPADFFRSGRTAHSRDGSFGKTGETERIRCGQERRIPVFPGQGSRRNAVPLVRGAGGETSGAGQGRQTLVWVQGRSVLLQVEGGKPRPIGLLFTAARIGYYLPKMSHKNPGFARQEHLKNQQNCKKENHGFRKNAENTVKRKTESLQERNKKKQKGR